MRTSYEIYELAPDGQPHSLDLITHIKPRGFGFGGENTIALPVITVLNNGLPVNNAFEVLSPRWMRDVWNGDLLKSSYNLRPLDPKKTYRILVTTDNRILGKEISGYHSFAASGIVVTGPMGETEVTLQ